MATVSNLKKTAAQGNVTTEAAFALSSDSTKASAVYLPGGSKFDGRPFRILATAKFTGGNQSGNTITLALYSGTDTTLSNDTKIATTAAVAAVNAKGILHLEFYGVANSNSGKLDGRYYGFTSTGSTEALVTAAAITGQATLDPSSASASGFIVSAVFGASHASNAITLTDFRILVD